MPRTKEFEPAEALDRAMEQFWRHGYRGTGLDDLVRRTEASRYGLYTTFGGKRDLFLSALERYSQAVMDPMIGRLEAPGASAAEIRGFFDRVLRLIRRFTDRRGCLMCNTAFDGGPGDPAAARRVQRHFDRVRRLLGRSLANARRDGALGQGVVVRSYADHLLGAAAGAFLLARARISLVLIRRFVHTALRDLD